MNEARWILADASVAGIVRFGCSAPGADRVDSIVSLQGDRHPTFTDALLTYERQAGVPLRGAEAVLAIPAPPAGDAIPVARSRWTISRSGLNAMFGRPVAVINDVAATAWSLLAQPSGKLDMIGGPAFDFTRPGRWAVILLDLGVNAAALEIGEDGICSVLDGEGGHSGFSPGSEAEMQLMRTLAQRHHHVPWEAALNGGWADPHATAELQDAWAGLAGSFVGDCILNMGAWSGVILTGRHCPLLRDPQRQRLFARRLEDKNRYARFLAAGSRAFLTHADPLAGALSLLNARRKSRLH